MSAIRTRELAPADVPVAVELVNAEGWTFTAAEVHRMLALGGGVVVEEEGRVLGLLTLITHKRLAWIGNVAVRPDARGRGLGARLVDAALALAAARGVETVGLYSVLPAVSLYERAGFVKRGRVLSLHGAGRGGRGGALPAAVAPLNAAWLPEVERLDARRSGDDRGRMIRALATAFPRTSFVLSEGGRLRGFVITKTSESGAEIGPLVVADPADADAFATLYDAALAALPAGEPVEVGVRAENATALALLKDRGFAESFPGIPMYRGEPGHELDPLATGAVAGMEKG